MGVTCQKSMIFFYKVVEIIGGGPPLEGLLSTGPTSSYISNVVAVKCTQYLARPLRDIVASIMWDINFVVQYVQGADVEIQDTPVAELLDKVKVIFSQASDDVVQANKSCAVKVTIAL